MPTPNPLAITPAAAAPSDWVQRHAGALASGSALDLACGGGRHVRWLAARGHRVTAVDRDGAALAGLRGIAARCIEADLEAQPWPLTGERYALVVVTNYLWRPLLPHIVASVAPGGWLVYETFALGHEVFGRPSRPDFLLRPLELVEAVRGELHVAAFEDRLLPDPQRRVQRIAACRAHADGSLPLQAG